MSYVDKTLLPDEQISFRTKKHYIIFTVPMIFLLLALLFYTDNTVTRAINGMFTGLMQHNFLATYITRVPALIFALAAVYSGSQQWLMYLTSDYAVTNKRVIMKEGFFDRVLCDTRLTTVSHVTVEQPLLGQFLNYGTVVINGFGGTRDIFIQLASPNEFQKAVHAQLDKIAR